MLKGKCQQLLERRDGRPVGSTKDLKGLLPQVPREGAVLRALCLARAVLNIYSWVTLMSVALGPHFEKRCFRLFFPDFPS